MLSQWIRVGCFCGKPINDNNVCNHITSFITWSASVDKPATVDFFLEDQDIAPLPRLKQYPDMDFPSSISCMKSELACPCRTIGCFPPSISLCECVPFKNSRLLIEQPSSGPTGVHRVLAQVTDCICDVWVGCHGCIHERSDHTKVWDVAHPLSFLVGN